ncbi:DUF2850 domain-containing protein [Photobacterium sp. SDRW27]|uniref:DUF2850 domain-containing protein n=1 Tax=Photobacterium obscurum TaxID=2829490 RepID=UPI002242F948|nr:DUF2850 domain-containing protein [Photobacterium obscurum]MCW8331306.1 DUF2850 domain-containing protein [Photobacterium obscurum]
MATITIGLIFSTLLAVGVIDNEVFAEEPPISLNGVWVELDVAPYVADRFEIRPEGVFVDGRQVNTHYEWDGSTLKYRLGEDDYVYTYLSERLIRQKPAHYISSFAREVVFQ